MSKTTEVTWQMPIIHMNGSSAESLMKEYRSALDALQAAIEAFGDIDFNMRDYYPVVGAWEKALSERNQHRQALNSAYQYLLDICKHLYGYADRGKGGGP